jgi:hypothetical protein
LAKKYFSFINELIAKAALNYVATYLAVETNKSSMLNLKHAIRIIISVLLDCISLNHKVGKYS